MKSVAFTKAELKERTDVTGSDEKYPWGLRLELNTETLDKLGIDSLPKAGKSYTLTAKVKVTGTSSNDRADGETSRSVSLQITAMELDSNPASAKEAIDEVM